MNTYSSSIHRLQTIVQELRVKCPWDQKQTIHTLRSLSIEELYELADAIDKEDWIGIKEELGDLLLHLLFYAQIAEEAQQFTFADVIETICNKLVKRHPHVYSYVTVDNADDVKRNWESIKTQGKESILKGVPNSLPAMVKAYRLQDKTKSVGFEFENIEQVKSKVMEEWQEFEEAQTLQDRSKMQEEFGDLLFSLVNLGRFMGLDPEQALEQTNQKFIRRFSDMEVLAWEQNLNLTNMSLEDLDKLWSIVKLKG